MTIGQIELKHGTVLTLINVQRRGRSHGVPSRSGARAVPVPGFPIPPGLCHRLPQGLLARSVVLRLWLPQQAVPQVFQLE